MQTTRDNPKVITQSILGDPLNVPSDPIYRPVVLSAGWANYTNPYSPAYGMTAFARMVAAAGIWNSTRKIEPYNVPFAIESIIVGMLANGISRVNYNATTAGILKGQVNASEPWAGGSYESDYMPKGVVGPGGNAYDISTAEQALASKFVMHAKAYGYAYSATGIAQTASMVVLLVYYVIALAHTIYACCTGWTSSAWDTPSEVAMLALSSERTTCVVNTGAGIEAMKTFEETVKIRARDDCIEMVFRDTQFRGDIVRPGVKYG